MNIATLKKLYNPKKELQTKKFYAAADKMPRPKVLFNVDKNAKTVKGRKKKYMTAILYLAPAKRSGYQVCASASPGCIKGCLFTAGHGSMHVNQVRRIIKTRYFFHHREEYMQHLEREILNLKRLAKKQKYTLTIRLNGTSDLLWEVFSYRSKNDANKKSLIERFPELQFYDYTKHSKKRRLPVNYDITFSRAENNDNKARLMLARGTNVTMVFRGKLPKMYEGVKVVDGDKDDLRFLDPKGGVIVGLKAKGPARYDESGFVIDLNN